MKRVVTIFLVSLFLSIVIVSTPEASLTTESTHDDVRIGVVSQLPNPEDFNSTERYTVYSAISFAAAGFTGSGTIADPYVLEGVFINTTQSCITIQQQTAHFVIRNCFLASPIRGSGQGFNLWEVENGVIENCTIYNMRIGFSISDCSDITITDNTMIQGSYTGIGLYESDNVQIENNIISDYDQNGFYCSNGVASFINNTISNTYLAGEFTLSDDSIFINNTIENNVKGIQFDSDNGDVIGNTFTDNEHYGLYIEMDSQSMVIKNNTFTNSAFKYRVSTKNKINDIAYNTANGKPLGFIRDIANVTMDTDTYGQIILVNCSNIWIKNGSITNSGGISTFYCFNITIMNSTLSYNTEAIYLEESINCTIFQNTFTDNYYGLYYHMSVDSNVTKNTFENCGVYFNGLSFFGNRHNISDSNTVNGKTIGYFWNYSNLILDGDDYGQILLANCTNITVTGGVFNRTTTGIFSAKCSNITWSDIVVSNNLHGIRVVFCTNFTLLNSKVTDCDALIDWKTSSVENVIYDTKIIRIEGTEFLNNGVTGLSCYAIENGTFLNNVFLNSLDSGLYITDSAYCTVRTNLASECEDGISLQNFDESKIINNTAIENTYAGIRISSSENTSIYDNLIAWNTPYDAMDTISTNILWDDNVSLGNLWGNYSGVGTYTIPGSSESVDRYPRKADLVAPIISSPDDLIIEYGDEGYSITWSAEEEHTKEYIVWLDDPDDEIKDGEWFGQDITVRVDDDLPLGIYTYSCLFRDTCHNDAIDNVTVSVVDTTSPMIDSPDDMEFLDTDTGLTITWTPIDWLPDSYQILADGEEVESGSWSTGVPIVYNLPNMTGGIYTVTLRVNDTSGNFATDTVILTVTGTLFGFDLMDPQNLLMIGAVVGVMVVIVVVVRLTRRR